MTCLFSTPWLNTNMAAASFKCDQNLATFEFGPGEANNFNIFVPPQATGWWEHSPYWKWCVIDADHAPLWPPKPNSHDELDVKTVLQDNMQYNGLTLEQMGCTSLDACEFSITSFKMGSGNPRDCHKKSNTLG